MFDLIHNSSDAGYELRIGYSTAEKKFYVRGYIVFRDNDGLEYSRDGSTQWFNTQEEAFKFIAEHD